MNKERPEFGTPSHNGQARLITELNSLEAAFGRAVRAARAAGEQELFAQLDARWQALDALVSPVLFAAQPAKLFK